MKLGELQGRSAASFLREALEAAMPMLEAMLPVYQAAADQAAMHPKALQKAIRDALANVDAQAAQMNLLHLLANSADLANDADPAPSGAREEAALGRGS